MTKHLSDFQRNDPTMQKEFVKLDSVGGTVLFVKSGLHPPTLFLSLFLTSHLVLLLSCSPHFKTNNKSGVHKQGVIFPTDYIVGTTWDHFGFDGIEVHQSPSLSFFLPPSFLLPSFPFIYLYSFCFYFRRRVYVTWPKRLE